MLNNCSGRKPIPRTAESSMPFTTGLSRNLGAESRKMGEKMGGVRSMGRTHNMAVVLVFIGFASAGLPATSSSAQIAAHTPLPNAAMQSPGPHTAHVLDRWIACRRKMRGAPSPLCALRGGGLYKKLRKGLPIDAAEKIWMKKALKMGANRILMQPSGESRQELAERNNVRKRGTRDDRRLALRVAEKTKLEIESRNTRSKPIDRRKGGGRPKLEGASNHDADGNSSGGLLKFGETEAVTEGRLKAAVGWRFEEAARNRA